MRILVTGITGFVGRNLAAYWNNDPKLIIGGTGRSLEKSEHLPGEVVYLPLQLTDVTAVSEAFNFFCPDVVIHCAAMSKPNECEVQQEICYNVNVNATKNVIDVCKQLGCRLVFMSTDFVFGDNGPYSEEDAYAPVNYYGQSKVFAEEMVKQSGLHWAIVRTVLVYGSQLPGLQPTFPQWVKGQLDLGKTIRVFTDQYRTATYIHDLVNGVDAIVQQNASGIFHLCGEEILTPFDIAQQVATNFGLDASLVQPVTRNDFAEPARRPLCSALHIQKAKSELGYAPRSLSDVLPGLF